MASNEYHVKLKAVDATGTISTLIPKNTSDDVSIISNNENIGSSKTMSDIIDNLGDMAFKDETSTINNNTTVVNLRERVNTLEEAVTGAGIVVSGDQPAHSCVWYQINSFEET